ncbi:hypothetical protein P691DRAFT_797152 [Macrolepiota fuliginosa MF-IS2]|uniref:BTB domain-containing protein n=1 Tax=Macrolepiota fuliginosa MF-IS2 TaxID=1400762 RepID=A0A9P5X6D5_9AGAR|nr:hypothetical protein P691DRAFT_797152 [Macrolepiota fuliginosa MF-IS2]
MPRAVHNDIEYSIEPLTFRVENILFRVPREYLVQESPVFLDILALPQPVTGEEGVSTEGTVDAKPLVLPDTITASAFRALLWVLYPADRLFNSDVGLLKDDWVMILELSRMWDMIRVREIAIERLVPLLKDDPAHQWDLAKKYEIQDWVRPALERLIRRSLPLSNREVEMLDQETLLKLAAARESCYPVLRDSDPSRYGYINGEDTAIGHWVIRQERGQINVNLDTITFNCPISLKDNEDQPFTLAIDGPRRNGEFYIEKVVFQVEDDLYKVPNQPFSQHSPIFRRRFKNQGFVKFSHHNPLVIDSGVTKADFECLLRFFFPPNSAGEWEPSFTEWASILTLSAKWEMDRVKSLAVQKLEKLDFGSVVTKLRMAQELGVQDWFVSGMKTLVTRQEPLSAHECQVLDLRERAHHRTQYNHYGHSQSITHLRLERGEIPNNECDLTIQLTDLL